MDNQYDAILLVSFGGPEGRDDVLPFLENVLRGRNVPRERMLEVAEHYYHYDGVSPINAQNRELIAALEKRLQADGPFLPVYFGNRNWHPMMKDTLTQMKEDGVKRALALITSSFSCYSGCRQYRENIYAAQDEIGEGAPHVDKIRVFYNHPGFVETMADRLAEALSEFPEEVRRSVHFTFTAHSIPQSMSDGSDYVKQLSESSRLVAENFPENPWKLVYQSRSGPPQQPWLEPDICDHINELATEGHKNMIIIPIGFISDHMEVMFDLDTEAMEESEKLGIKMVRAKTAGTHPRFIEMLRELILERVEGTEKLSIGNFGPNHDVCPKDCCKYTPTRPPSRPQTT